MQEKTENFVFYWHFHDAIPATDRSKALLFYIFCKKSAEKFA
jgi:hypothetical protein